MATDPVAVNQPGHSQHHPHLKRKRKSARRWCPFCKRRRAARARPKGVFEMFLPLVFIRPFMCRQCRVRHYGVIFWDRLSFDPIRFKVVLAISIWLIVGYQALMSILGNPPNPESVIPIIAR